MCTKEKCIGLQARLEIGLNIKFTNYHSLNNTLQLMLSFFLLVALEGHSWFKEMVQCHSINGIAHTIQRHYVCLVPYFLVMEVENKAWS